MTDQQQAVEAAPASTSTPKAPPPNDTTIMILAAASAVVVGIVVIALLVLVVVSQTGSKSEINANSPTGPYNTLARPVPIATTVYELLPTYVGDFTLTDVSGSLEAGYTAHYQFSGQTLQISGRQAVNVPAAQYAVDLIRQARGPASEAERIIGSDYGKSYYLDVKPNDVRFAWSRERWFFDIQTDSLETLTAFMVQFQF
ncbi:MAG: hypothetical protein KF726_11175 [Anaerolineae bacterium]|nr:hypothetical protein [Anaerolineae bacterium]